MLRKVVAGLICLAIIFSFTGCFGNKYDTDFTIKSRVGLTNNDFYELSAKDVKSIDNYEKKFNYFGVKYASDSYLKCSIVYIVDEEEIREEFFLEPSKEETNFYSFIDNALEKVTAKRVIEFGLNELSLRRIETRIMTGNASSRRVAEKLGMKEEGILRKAILKDGKEISVCICSILK